MCFQLFPSKPHGGIDVFSERAVKIETTSLDQIFDSDDEDEEEVSCACKCQCPPLTVLLLKETRSTSPSVNTIFLVFQSMEATHFPFSGAGGMGGGEDKMNGTMMKPTKVREYRHYAGL